jgi:hypothetical protein
MSGTKQGTVDVRPIVAPIVLLLSQVRLNTGLMKSTLDRPPGAPTTVWSLIVLESQTFQTCVVHITPKPLLLPHVGRPDGGRIRSATTMECPMRIEGVHPFGCGTRATVCADSTDLSVGAGTQFTICRGCNSRDPCACLDSTCPSNSD